MKLFFKISIWLIIILFLLATIVKSYMNRVLIDGPVGIFYDTTSLQESKKEGVFMHELIASPSSFLISDKEIIIKNAWVEHRSRLDHRFIWFHYLRHIDGYNISMTINPNKKLNYEMVPFWLESDMTKYVYFDAVQSNRFCGYIESLSDKYLFRVEDRNTREVITNIVFRVK